jgi:hypothetical protein
MAKKKSEQKPAFETLGQVLDTIGIKRTAFGEAVGWKNSTIPMKLNRKRNWTVEEYEKALALALSYNLPVTREDMQRFAMKVG